MADTQWAVMNFSARIVSAHCVYTHPNRAVLVRDVRKCDL